MRPSIGVLLGMCALLLSADTTPGQDKAKDKAAAPKAKEQTATAAEVAQGCRKISKPSCSTPCPKDKQGSWVNMCVDPKGRLIVSDQIWPALPHHAGAIGGEAVGNQGRKTRPAARRSSWAALRLRQPLRHGQ